MLRYLGIETEGNDASAKREQEDAFDPGAKCERDPKTMSKKVIDGLIEIIAHSCKN